jgi:thioester reductase-like protein
VSLASWAPDDQVGALSADAELAAGIGWPGQRSAPPPASAEPGTILLTGGTGFIGAFTLHELLRRTTADIYCLVRADTAAAAAQKIRWTQVKYRLWDESFAGRVIPVTGDLERSRLGVAPDQYETLATEVSAIFHTGARVNHIEPYERLRAANVGGTREILRLASQSRVKHVHFTSSVSAVERNDRNPPVVREDARIEPWQTLPRGYIRSKWAAEELLRKAGDRGIPTTIYRLDRVSGHTVSGACGTDDSFWNLIRSMILVRAAPVLQVDSLNLVPVDYVASAIVKLSTEAAATATAFHLVSPQIMEIERVIAGLLEEGYVLERLPFDDWADRLEDVAQRLADRGDPSLVAATVLTSSYRGGNTPFLWGRDRAEALLVKAGIECPVIDSGVLKKYFAYFVSSRFFPPPSKQARSAG